MNPIAYTYDADTFCVTCTIERFGRAQVTTYSPATFRDFPPESARDSEGNPLGAVFSYDEWHEPATTGRFTLACGSCGTVIDSCDHSPVHEQQAGDPGDECNCPSCLAAEKVAGQ